MIISSFQTQYGIRLSRDLKDMKWDEFTGLVSGLGPETPLGRIVSIRAENNKDVLKHFSREQHRIRNDWRRKGAKAITKEQYDKVLEGIKNAFISMAGKKVN